MALHAHTRAQRKRIRGKSAAARKKAPGQIKKRARSSPSFGESPKLSQIRSDAPTLREGAARPKRRSARGNAKPGSAGRASSNRARPSLPNGVLASATSGSGFVRAPRTRGRGTGGRKGTANPQGIIRGSGGRRVPQRRALPVPGPSLPGISPLAPSSVQAGVTGGIRGVNLGTTDQRRRRRR